MINLCIAHLRSPAGLRMAFSPCKLHKVKRLIEPHIELRIPEEIQNIWLGADGTQFLTGICGEIPAWNMRMAANLTQCDKYARHL